MNDSGAQPISLWIAMPPGARHSPRSIPIAVVFQNSGSAAIGLLRHFDPVPVFFTIDLMRADGTPISLPGAGKMDLLEGTRQQLSLAPNELFGTIIDIAQLVPATEPLAQGRYTLRVSYHNQYGDGVFQGVLASNPIMLEIGA